MKKHKQVDRDLLKAYFSGKNNREQLDTIRQYLTRWEYKKSLNDFLQSEWFEAQDGDHAIPTTSADYERFLLLVKDGAGTRAAKAPVFNMRRFAAVAVVTALLGVCALVCWQELRYQRNEAEWVELKNEAGKRTVFFLPDSTKVYLGASSDLRYNKNYNRSNRTVDLNGEAYFIVHHQRALPFSVITDSLTTVDIGTEFNIRAIANHSNIDITVAKGAVDVMMKKGNGESQVDRLSAYEQLTYSRLTGAAIRSVLPVSEDVGGWRNGLLVFQKQTLGYVADELERFYGVRMEFGNPSLENILITTTLENASLNDALEIISITAGVKMTNRGSSIVIENKNPS